MTDAEPLGLDETQRMLCDSVVAFVARHAGLDRMRALREREPGFERTTWGAMAENGWFGLLVPEADGGLGLGFGELRVVMEELGRGLVPEPVAAAAVLAGGTIAFGDNLGLRAGLLPAILGGDILPALAWQERNGVYDPEAVAATVVRTAGFPLLSGVKRFVPAASGADGFVVSARGAEGLELWWVPASAPGVHFASARRVDGGFLGDVTFDGVRLDAGACVASAAVATAALTRAVDEARLAACAELLGVMGRALDITLDYVKQRTQFGRPIGAFQALQHRIVDMWTQQQLARASVRDAVRVFDATTDPRERAVAVSAAKARCGDAALLVTRQGIQLHGGMGYTDEADIGLYLKRALVLSAWLGNAVAHRRRFAELAPDE